MTVTQGFVEQFFIVDISTMYTYTYIGYITAVSLLATVHVFYGTTYMCLLRKRLASDEQLQ